ncbi:CoA transferase [Halostagnicola sp. A-GB9-2]|uniref:CaiB/BaiF CoA transferase family protein n=1 Tax=Halostagnicola sp. A-GB9-2 TaxID=3048066 RepID=UPI0024BF96C6|nr:CoA transferase [Halostagnicola sp. A-GB9-2]MDJ1433802.1 CoA transferase [Halostagnicola sp. A-GB9-2]
MREKPLADITVLDLSQAVAAPCAGVLLADFGANVISIEPPGGGSEREYGGGSTMPNFGRNKRSIVVDLKTDDGTDVLHRLVEDADVLIHNNRPGKMTDLGCDYETLSAVNPQLVYCSVTGYGEDGPYRDRPGFDPLAQAMSGLMWTTGEPDRKPSRIGASTIDIGTGIYAAFAIWPALRHARATGEGQKIEASLFDTAAAFMGHWYTLYDKTGEQPQRQGHSWELYAPSGVFETGTDPIYLSTPFQHLWERVAEAVDRPEWIDDPRFETGDDRAENRAELAAELESEFADYERDELLDLLIEAGVPASELKTVAEAARDEHLHERGTLQEIEDVDGSEVTATATPVSLSETPGRIERGPPSLGEHSRDVLAEFGFDDDAIERLVGDEIVHDG